MSSVGIEYPMQLARCQALVDFYETQGPGCALAATMIRAVMKQAEEAWRSQNLPEIVAAFAAMQDCE